MLPILIGIIVSIAILTVPLMLVAKFIGAERTDFKSCLLAVIVQVVADAILRALFGGNIALIGFIIYVAIYKYMLETTWVKALIISIMTNLLLWAIMLLGLASFMYHTAP
ncbi:hypothetical protein [Saezia sanguinis]|uniref:hypothetical protein n=1 Tax=Saezia sanguinis TaxID=1965230 RepID=UPI00304E64EE